MKKEVSFGYQIDPLWDAVKQIRDGVESSLEGYSEELVDASKMTASELIENAVKYGRSIEKGAGIQFNFSADGDKIRIHVSNKILTQEDYETFISHIDLINESDNPEELYLERLKMLMDNTKLSKTQLGLFRIAYEGEFSLSYDFTDSVLTVSAVRDVQ